MHSCKKSRQIKALTQQNIIFYISYHKMTEAQEDFNSLSAILFATQDDQIQASLQLFKSIYNARNLEELIRMQEFQKEALFNEGELAFLYSQLANTQQLFESFSLWCLEKRLVPQKQTSLKWIMLISLSMHYQKSIVADSSQNQISLNKDVQNEISSKNLNQSFPEYEYSLYSKMQQSLSINQNFAHQSQLIRLFLQLKQNQEMLELLIISLNNNTHDQQLLAWREIIYKINKHNENNSLRLAFLYFSKKEFQNTIKVISCIPQNSQYYPQAKQLSACCLKQQGNLIQAIEQMKKALYNQTEQEHQHLQRCLYQLAQMCITLHRYVQAAYYLQQCVSKHQKNVQFRLLHASCMVKEGLYDKAQKLLQNISFQFDNVMNQEQKAKMFTLLGHVHSRSRLSAKKIETVLQFYDKALQYYLNLEANECDIFFEENPVQNDQNDHENVFYYFKGLACQNMGKYNKAQEYLNICIERNPNFLQPYISLVIINISQEIVLDKLNKIVELLPTKKGSPMLIKRLNAMLFHLEKTAIFKQSKAKKQQHVLPDLEPKLYQKINTNKLAESKLTDIMAWINMWTSKIVEQFLHSIMFFFHIKRYQLSLLILQTLKLTKTCQQLVYELCGRCYLQMKQFQKAKKQFDLALEKNPTSLTALKGQLIICITQQSQNQVLNCYQKLVKIYEKLENKQIQCYKQQCSYQRKLGLIYFEMNRIKQSVKWVKRSLEILPADQSCFSLIAHLEMFQNASFDTITLIEAIQKYKDKKNQALIITAYLLRGECQKCRKQLTYFIPKNERQNHFIDVAKTVVIILQQQKLNKQNFSQNIFISLKTYLDDLRILSLSQNIPENELKINIFTRNSIAYTLAEKLFKGEFYEQASDFYEVVNDLSHHQKIIKQLEICYKKTGRKEKHIECCQILIQKFEAQATFQGQKAENNKEPDLSRAENSTIKELIRLYKQTNSSEKLYRLLKLILAQKANNFSNLSDMVDLQFRFKNNFEAALEYLNRMIQIQPIQAFKKMRFLSQSDKMQNYLKASIKNQGMFKDVFLSGENQNNPFVLTLLFLYLEYKHDAIKFFADLLRILQAKLASSRPKAIAQINKMLPALKKIEVYLKDNILVKIMSAILYQYTKKQPNTTNQIVQSLTSPERLLDYIQLKRFQELAKLKKSHQFLMSSEAKIDELKVISFTNIDYQKPFEEILKKWISQSSKIVKEQIRMKKIQDFRKEWVKFAHSLRFISSLFNKQEHEDWIRLLKQFEEGRISQDQIKAEFRKLFEAVKKARHF